MKRNGFTLMEMMFVVAIGVAIFAILFGLLMASKNSWLAGNASVELQQKARIAMDKITRELRLADSSVTAIRDCGTSECRGQIITFRIPAASAEPRANTIYSDTGNIKWGAENVLYNEIQFYVKYTTNELVRAIVINNADGACCHSGACASLSQTTCTAIPDASYMGASTSCSTNYICIPAPPPPPPCFLGDTPILMADGTTKPIKEMRAGDEITAFNEESKTLVKDKVKRLSAYKNDQYLIINNHLKITPNHQVYSRGKWVAIGSLKIGEPLLNSQGKEEPIKNIKLVRQKVTVYDLEINPFHNYFAGGILAHNSENLALQPEQSEGGCWQSSELFRDFLAPGFAYADEASITEKIIATDIISVSFGGIPTPFKPKIVEITVTAQNNILGQQAITGSFTSRVALRN